MKLFKEHRASSFNEPEDKTLTKSEALPRFSHHQPLIGVATSSVATSCCSTAKPDNNNKLPDSLLQVLEYVKGRHEVGPPIYLGDDPEPGDTVYDTTVNPLPLSPSKPVRRHIPRHERTQLQLPRSRHERTQVQLPRSKPASLASIREEDSQTSFSNRADLVSSSRQIEEEANPPDFYLVKSDRDPKISTEDPLPQSCSSAEAGDLNFMMLNARRLKEFLTENVDEHATNLLFLTIHGTLLAHNVTSDPTISVKAFRKFSAFAGPTFGLHDTAIATTGKVSPNPGFFGGRVLKVFTRGDGKGLKSMIVEQDEIVGVVVYCKDDTLIAAQLPKDSFPSDDDLLAKPQKLELDNNDAAIGQIHGNQGDASDESSVDEDEDGASNSSKRKGKSRSEDTTDEEENKPSRMRILELRAEAIAEVMVEDELKDFVMPKDFH